MTTPPSASIWQLRDQQLDLSIRPLVMGIVNITPDSFSDGGRFQSAEQACAHAFRLVEQGADILDLGGESTRPGSQPVPVAEEVRRVLPVVQMLMRSPLHSRVLLSIDTTKAEVAEQCLHAGAHIINDVTALRGDPDLADVVRSHRAGVILMHMQGTPATMQSNPTYADVVSEVQVFLQTRLHAAVDLGIAESSVVLDPGIGFGKTDEHNWRLLAHLEKLQQLGRPVCLGVSRKGFLGRLLDRPVSAREAGSLAVAIHALARRSAQILRVHEVAFTSDAVRVLSTLAEREETDP